MAIGGGIPTPPCKELAPRVDPLELAPAGRNLGPNGAKFALPDRPEEMLGGGGTARRLPLFALPPLGLGPMLNP